LYKASYGFGTNYVFFYLKNIDCGEWGVDVSTFYDILNFRDMAPLIIALFAYTHHSGSPKRVNMRLAF
jgi:hypothetical protein